MGTGTKHPYRVCNVFLKRRGKSPARFFTFNKEAALPPTPKGAGFRAVDRMNERLVDNWNALVKPGDTVFFLGDFGLGTTNYLASICARLHGNKICIRGNHDGTPAKMQKIGFLFVLESAFIKIGRHQVELVHVPEIPAPAHFQLHGHVHEKRSNKLVGAQLNLSVEVWDY